ncbi:MAG: hypothetical protein Hens2KO_00960 [Henriciella sp.]
MRGLAILLASTLVGGAAFADEAGEPMLTHAVYFDLEQDDAASVQALIDGCYEYLAPHDGIVYFSAGARHKDYDRDVNDLEFDVALTIVFENTAAQDAYQVTEPHLQFIEEFNENWASVRVFDSLAPAPSDPDE